jgi:dolichol-phosphate mannosyltransferase
MNVPGTVIIVLPAFNEEGTLPNMLDSIDRAMRQEGFEYVSIVVNDGSEDATGNLAREFATRMPIIVVDHERHLGLGESIRTGLLHALERAVDRDIIATADVANIHSPMLVLRMVRGVEEGCDVIVASRYHNGATVEEVPAYRKALSGVANLGFRLLYPTPNVRDFTSGYRAYRAQVLKAVLATYRQGLEQQSGFSSNVDILLKLRRMRASIGEVPLLLRYEPKHVVTKTMVMRALASTLRLMALENLDHARVGAYFTRPDTVEPWWHPDTGPLAFHYNAELAILQDHFPIDRCLRVLDVGTGRGRVGAHFAQRGCRVVGIDPNRGMLAAARQTARQLSIEDRFELKLGKAEDLSEFQSGEFDLVLCMELFDHLPDLQSSLEEMRRTLKPGGHLLFTYVPTESLYGIVGNLYRWFQTRRGGAHSLISRTYRLGEIRRRLAEHGLQLERYWGVGILCVNAQTRMFANNALVRLLTAVARAEAARVPYYKSRLLARHAAHVVGIARAK